MLYFSCSGGRWNFSVKSNSNYKTRRYLASFTCNTGLKPGRRVAYADHGCSSLLAAGRAAEQERSPSLEMLRSQRLIKYKRNIYSTQNWEDDYLRATLCSRSPTWSTHPLASSTALLSINKVAKPGCAALVGSVSSCLRLPRPRQLLPPRRQAGRRQSVANRLLVQAININKPNRALHMHSKAFVLLLVSLWPSALGISTQPCTNK